MLMQIGITMNVIGVLLITWSILTDINDQIISDIKINGKTVIF